MSGATGGASLYNTIVALNTIGTGVNPKPSDIAGTVILTSSFNLIGDAKSSVR